MYKRSANLHLSNVYSRQGNCRLMCIHIYERSVCDHCWFKHLFQIKIVHTIKYNTMFNHTNMSMIVYAQIPLINAFTDLSSKVRCLTFGMSLHLYLYFMYASSEGSGESAIKRRLA